MAEEPDLGGDLARLRAANARLREVIARQEAQLQAAGEQIAASKTQVSALTDQVAALSEQIAELESLVEQGAYDILESYAVDKRAVAALRCGDVPAFIAARQTT